MFILKLFDEFLDTFEVAIDCLRSGLIYKANIYLNKLNIQTIKYNREEIYPCLNTNDYLEKLHVYEDLRDQQIKPKP